MKVTFSWPSPEEWKGFGRHVVTYSAGFATGAAGLFGYAAALHFITPEQSATLAHSLTDMANSAALVVKGVGSFVGSAGVFLGTSMAVWAAVSSRFSPQKAAVVLSQVPGTTIVTDPAIAAVAPANVVSNVNHAVVPATPAPH